MDVLSNSSNSSSSASSFSQNGEYFALLSVDGRLRIWDTTSGKIVQEFSSNSVVQSSCTCLCWTNESFTTAPKKQKKQRVRRKHKESGATTSSITSVSVGTEKGAIFSYNPRTSDADASKESHSGAVNCMVYHNEQRTVFTCSQDKNIIEWNEEDLTIKSKWKGDDVSVTQLCLGPSGKTLLSAGCSIKLWNLDTREILQTFHGHSSPVSLLQFSPYCHKMDSGLPDDGYYFVSASTNDRVLSAWQVNSVKLEKNPIASFITTDVPKFLDVVLDDADEKPLKLCTGCVDGKVQFFTCTLNGRSVRPIESTKTVEYVAKEDGKALPFINGQLSKTAGDVNMNLVYGQTIRPIFTSTSYKSLEPVSKIELSRPSNILLKNSQQQQQRDKELCDPSAVQVADTTKCSTIIADANAPALPVVKQEKQKKKRKKRKKELLELNAKDPSLDDGNELKEEVRKDGGELLKNVVEDGGETKKKKKKKRKKEVADEAKPDGATATAAEDGVPAAKKKRVLKEEQMKNRKERKEQKKLNKAEKAEAKEEKEGGTPMVNGHVADDEDIDNEKDDDALADLEKDGKEKENYEKGKEVKEKKKKLKEKKKKVKGKEKEVNVKKKEEEEGEEDDVDEGIVMEPSLGECIERRTDEEP